MNYLISISYDGSKFEGFQRLNNKVTVQGEIERVLTKINKSPVTIKGAGRTDKGAHAIDQNCHFTLDFDLEPYNLKRSINDLINKSIYVNKVTKVSDDFHARFSVRSKQYQYLVNTGEYNPISKDYVYFYRYKLNLCKMQHASKVFIGEHSFANFISGKRENSVATIESIKISKHQDLISFEFIGKSFYTYMIRNMVGALLEVGKGNMTKQNLSDLLAEKTSTIKYVTVPACGLYLKKIDY